MERVGAEVPNTRAGKPKALAVTSLEASPALPGVPPLADTYAGFPIDTWWGLVAPAATPPPVTHPRPPAPPGDQPAPPGFCGGGGPPARPAPLCPPAGGAGGLHPPAVRQLHG